MAKHSTKSSFRGVIIGSVITFFLLVGVYLLFLRPKELLNQQSTTSPTPVVSPTPLSSSTPLPKTTQKPTTTVSCDSFVGQPLSMVNVRLVPDSGQVTGSTVVRLIPGGSCPGATTSSEQWINPGQFTATFSNVSAGTYVIEVANGNYEGVVRQTVTIKGNTNYTFSVKVKG